MNSLASCCRPEVSPNVANGYGVCDSTSYCQCVQTIQLRVQVFHSSFSQVTCSKNRWRDRPPGTKQCRPSRFQFLLLSLQQSFYLSLSFRYSASRARFNRLVSVDLRSDAAGKLTLLLVTSITFKQAAYRINGQSRSQV